MQATCPVCEKVFEADVKAPGFPFCSRRCKLIDLGAWADERYRVPVPNEPDPGNEPPSSS